eukprot:TRINITY_DN929_c3_g1_i1.p1 TRINITY_DN929_c3_g1~~TRINITY_DN929_c3_g1_i1.p1  ORF type:complete len:131 (+),score=25.54 TRINITY_DN929_c3_g1_i1:284-676(+)
MRVLGLCIALLSISLVQISLGIRTRVPISRASTKASTWEQEFLSIPSPARAYEHLSYYTSIPHLAGTPGDAATAEWTQQTLQSFGVRDSRVLIPTLSLLLSLPLSPSCTDSVFHRPVTDHISLSFHTNPI